MSVRRTVSALVLLLVTGCGGAEAEPSTKAPAKHHPIDPVMEQRLAVDEPTTPRAPRSPTRDDGVEFARYFFESLDYAMRSGFSMDFRQDFNFYCHRCRAIWKRINNEYAGDHHIEMTPLHVDSVSVLRGPVRRPGYQKLTPAEKQVEPYFWVVEVSYHIDELAILDSEGEIESGTDLTFADRLLLASRDVWEVWFWKNNLSDPDAPILGKAPEVAA